MRPVLAIALLLCLGCGDPGLRDRSLMARLQADERARTRQLAVVSPQTGPKTRPTSASIIGLVPDDLAKYYAVDASLVLRFDDLHTLAREAAPQLQAVQKTLAWLALPMDDGADLLRRAFGLPSKVAIDTVRPFAIVRTEKGWVGILPTRNVEQGEGRVRPIDALYSVVGEPSVLAEYREGFQRGFYLPGDCSVLAQPGALATLGSTLTELTQRIGVDLTFLDRYLPAVPTDIGRLDLACRFSRSGLRLDVRVWPDPGSPTARFLARTHLKPGAAATHRWLPQDGTIYVEFASDPIDFEGLVLNLCRKRLAGMELSELLILQPLLNTLGRDTTAVVNLDSTGTATVLLLSRLREQKKVKAFLKSQALGKLLALVAGPDGVLEWDPRAFDHDGVTVASITGSVSRVRLGEWRQSGNIALATLGVLLRGPVITYVAVMDGKLCIVAGAESRTEMERFLDHLRNESPRDTEHETAVASLFPQRLASFSVNLAELFDGSREAASYWHANGHHLRNEALRWRIPAAGAVTIEGKAIRFAMRVPPQKLAEAIRKIRDALARD